MANSKNISRCIWCGDWYCCECSDAEKPFDFCNIECQFAEELKNEVLEDVDNNYSIGI
jgi:hypothetical protein